MYMSFLGVINLFILRKKRIALILCFLFLSFSAYFVSNNNINTTNRNYDITQVSALPVTHKVIVIDAGHGGEDGRCRRSFWYY